MRSGRACSVLASLLLLWLGVAAAQKASSWKTLSGKSFHAPLLVFFQVETLVRRQPSFSLHGPLPLLLSTTVSLMAHDSPVRFSSILVFAGIPTLSCGFWIFGQGIVWVDQDVSPLFLVD
jgi:hypothetical protein